MTADVSERPSESLAPPSEGAQAHRWPARLVGGVTGLVRAAIVVALAAILTLTVLQVLDRHFFRYGDFAFDQYSRVALVWLAFLGIAMGFRERVNIRIDLLDHFLPDRFAKRLRTVLDVVVLAVAASLIWVGWQLLEVGSFQVVMDTPLTYQVMYAALLAGLILLCLFLVLRLADVITAGRLGLDAKARDDHDRL
ncbi:TRAP transporter small permease [Chelatococcus sp. GCM10030263]|uniref:TRAP transporter small permease n=1 Tax=Chelatococcus sp. GCM10030263 TaxID=3273387 RepID=UPI00361E04F4